MGNIEILLVEDNAFEAMNIKKTLESFGYSVPCVAVNGDEAVDKALELMPDLVLMDNIFNVDEEDIYAVSKIKNLEIPVIYLTPYSDESFAQKTKLIEPYMCILKPYKSQELKYAIDVALYKKYGEKQYIQKENEVKKANSYNRGLIESSLDPLVTIGPDGKINDVNKATEKVTGCSREDLIGTDICDYFTEPDKVKEGYKKVFQDGFVRDYFLEIENKNGSVTPVLYNATVYKDEFGKVAGVFAAARDITDLKRIENIMLARSRLLEFAASHSLDELLSKTLDEIEGLTGSTMGFYVFLKSDQRTVSLENWSTNTLKMCTANGKGSHYDIEQAGVWVDCVYERRPVIHNDYKSLPHRKGLPEGHIPLINELVVPIFRGELIKAVIAVANKSADYGENDIEIVSQLGDLSWDIVERKKAEEKLQKSEKLMDQSQKIAHLGSWEFDIVNNRLYWSDEVYEIFGLHQREFRATYESFLEWVHVDDRKAVHDAYFDSIRDGRDVYEIEHRILKKSTGEIRVVHEKCMHFKDDSGRNIRSIGMVHDITERKKAEEKIQMLANVVESSDDAIISKSLDGTITSWNKGAELIYGYSEEEVLGKNVFILAPYQLKDEINQLIEKIKHCKHVLHYETVRLRKDGKIINVSITLSPIFDSSKNLVGISTIARDITQHKLYEEALKESEEKYRNIYEESFDGLFITSLEGKILDMNKKGIEILGYDSKDEILCLDLKNDVYAYPDDRNRILSMVNKDGSAEYEVVVKKRNGDKIITHCSLTAVKDEKGMINSYRGIIRDITQRKKNEEAILQAKEEWENTFDAVPDLISIIDTNYNIVRANRALANKLGTNPGETVGLKCYEVVHGLNAPPSFCPYLKLLENGQEHTAEVHEDVLGGDFIVSVSPLNDADGNLSGGVHVARDITGRKTAEEELKQSLKEKEVLISEIHHRVKNNMQIISSLLSLQSSYIVDTEAVSVLKESQDRVRAMSMIYEELYQSYDLVRIDFADYVQKLVNGLFYSHNVNEDQIKPVIDIENIMLNIETAIPCGLIISEIVSNSLKHAFPMTSNYEPTNKNFTGSEGGRICVSLKSSDDEYELKVSDDGVGLLEEINFKNKGTLGLKLVYALIDQIEGKVTLEKGSGITFKIIFKELKYKKRF